MKRRMFGVIGKGDNYFSSIHVDDAAAALVAALNAPSGTYNVVEDQPSTQLDYANAFAEEVHLPKPRKFPRWLGKLVMGGPANYILNSTRVSNKKFKEATGWAPKYPSVREGFHRSPKRWVRTDGARTAHRRHRHPRPRACATARRGRLHRSRNEPTRRRIERGGRCRVGAGGPAERRRTGAGGRRRRYRPPRSIEPVQETRAPSMSRARATYREVEGGGGGQLLLRVNRRHREDKVPVLQPTSSARRRRSKRPARRTPSSARRSSTRCSIRSSARCTSAARS